MKFNVFQNRTPLIEVEKLSSWKLYDFNDILLDDTKNGVKIKKEDYLKQGEYPIVDQGQSYISGFTNQSDGLYETDGALIFGDHTRIIKYVDFPLYLGADGVKLLKSKIDKTRVNMKYIYYFMKTIDLPSDGYSRHFKYLKEVVIPIPTLEIQNKIINTLDKAQELIDKRKEQIEACDELVKSRFIEMFGDPVQNPLDWELKPFLESGSCKNGMNFSATETGVELQYLGVGDFKDLSKIDDVNDLGKVSLNKMPSTEYLLQDGDIVFVRSNGNKALVGRCLAVYPNGVSTTYSGFCIRYRKTDGNLEIPYLLQVLKTDSMRKNMAGRGANIQNLNQQILGELMIPVPPLELQKQFTDFINQVDKLKFEMEQSLKELEDNFNSLMQRAFKGELFN
ncbi:restriction endonuclease subunit S [Clostridium sp.]|uniref:restriction endonuclease subunit S n=1 Tax=Clostridium sp. TaxID=1506 RepID=UPI0032175B27